ncbi:MarR family transcriptional regulator [uncultured Cyclobacterium sp.]|uniref:MarR family winged helix-turn-helix transcriptional regulator n=1 Tax=uncultured Cyclobacterium sp. TaxID=453820 RepID=UPI0030EEABAA|tara:strand:- start:327644 stop:328117 length:474 start_codon:yes stop_codon:yes gene_type:complete
MNKECNGDNTEYGILPWLGKTVKHIDIFINNNLKQAGIDLTKKQMLVLKALSMKGPLPQNDLAFITERDKASLVRFINTLEKKNLVARIPSPTDKRINMVHLTKHGEKVFQDTVPVFRKLVLQIQENIPEEELEQTARTLDKMKENIENLNSGCNSN